MAGPPPEIKSNRHGGNGHGTTHRQLLGKAERFLADRLIDQNPDLSYSQALAQARRELAATLRVHRASVAAMRGRNRVPPTHWLKIERATNGAVKAEDFESTAR